MMTRRHYVEFTCTNCGHKVEAPDANGWFSLSVTQTLPDRKTFDTVKEQGGEFVDGIRPAAAPPLGFENHETPDLCSLACVAEFAHKEEARRLTLHPSSREDDDVADTGFAPEAYL